MTSDPVCPACGRPVPVAGKPCLHCAGTQVDEGPPPADAASQHRIAGYRIVRRLGSGGMGTVYEALDTRMNRRVALKIMSRRLALSSDAADRFVREAWIAGRLNHPNLVKVYDRGEWEDLFYYSMELIEGGSLGDVIRNLKERGRDDALGLEYGSRDYTRWAASQIIAAARGLSCAHREGILHRDIKPMNLLLSRALGTVKVADFGLAVDIGATRLTAEGNVLGTPVYMSPEQILGKVDDVDARTDVYALGVTLFELLTLQLPYDQGSPQLYLEAVLTSEPRRASRINGRVSRDLETVIRKALEKDRRDRYATADDFADDLDNVLAFRPVRARPAGAGVRMAKWVRRRPIHAALAAILILGLPTLGVLGNRALQHQRLQRQIRLDRLESDLRWMGLQGRDADVVRTATEVLRIDPRRVSALRARAMAFLHLWEEAGASGTNPDLEEKALADAVKLIGAAPGVSWPHRVAARILKRLGRGEEALQAETLAARHASASPTDEDLFFDALLAFDGLDYPRAVDLATRAIQRNPVRADAMALRGDAHAEAGNLQQAILDYRVVLALEPDFYLNHFFLGRLLVRSGARGEGSGHIRRALEMAPAEGRSHEHLSDMLIQLGALVVSEGGQALDYYEKAEAEARAGLVRDPGSARCHVNLGVSLVEQERALGRMDPARIGTALEHYRRALETWREPGSEAEPDAYEAALMNLCDIRIRLGELPAALEQCLEASRLLPNQINSHYNLAGVYARLGRPDDTFVALERGFALGDRDWQYLASDPWFESVRPDPRFKSLLDRMKAEAD